MEKEKVQEQQEHQEHKEGLKDKVGDLTDHIGDYLDTLYKLTIVKTTQKATNIASLVVVAIAVSTLGMFVLLFASIGLSWWVGNLINSRVGGFLVVAGFYLLVLLIIILLRKKIVFPFFRKLIMRIYD
jgi:hypothetical protein